MIHPSTALPCPFCGSSKQFWRADRLETQEGGEKRVIRTQRMTCGGCGAQGPAEVEEEKAFAGWQRRVGG